MFENFKKFAGELFDFDTKPQTQSKKQNLARSNREGGAQSNKIPDERLSTSRTDMQPKSIIFGLSRAQSIDDGMLLPTEDVWAGSGIDKIYSENKLKKSFNLKFLKEVRKYGKPQKYQQPNIQLLKEFSNDCHDMLLINQGMEEQDRVMKLRWHDQSSIFLMNHYPFYRVAQPSTKILSYDFKSLPRSFRSRDISELELRINLLRSWEKILIQKMAFDSSKFSKSINCGSRQVELIEQSTITLLSTVLADRRGIEITRKACFEAHVKIRNAFKKKLIVEKTIHILKKFKKKYGPLIKYATMSISNFPLQNMPDIYRIFVVSEISFKEDSRKYTKLNLFGVLESAILNQLMKLRKNMRNYLYRELRRFKDSPTISPHKELSEMLKLYEKLVDVARALMRSQGCPSHVSGDTKLIWEHLEYIKRADPSMMHPRIEQCIRNFSCGAIAEE